MSYITGIDHTVHKLPLWLITLLQILVNLAAIVLFYAQCGTHLPALWTPGGQDVWDDFCIGPNIQKNYGYFQGSFNTLTDFYLAVLPAMVIWKIELPKRYKIRLWCCLCLSSV